MRRDVVIIGGGPAGLSAARLLAGRGLAVALVHKAALGGELPNQLWIEGYPCAGERTNGAQVAAQLIAQAQEVEAQFVLGEATAIELYSHSVAVGLSDHRAIQASAVLVATGRRRIAANEEIQSYEGRGLIACTACDAGFYRGQTVVVAGGGLAGALDALQLAAFAKRVVLVERGAALDCPENLRRQIQAHPGIEVLLGARVETARGAAGIETVQVTTAEGVQTLPATGLSMQLGHSPETQFLQGHGWLDSRGFVLADVATRAVVPRVFAIGDARSGANWSVANAIEDARAVADGVMRSLNNTRRQA